MDLDAAATQDVVKRLRRAEGQIRGLIRMLEQERGCAEVVTQLAAVSHALHRAGYKLVSSGMRQCFTDSPEGAGPGASVEQVEKLFRSLE